MSGTVAGSGPLGVLARRFPRRMWRSRIGARVGGVVSPFLVVNVKVSVRAWRHVCGRCGRLRGVVVCRPAACRDVWFCVVCVRVVASMLALQVLLRCCCFGAVFALASTRSRLCDVVVAVGVSGRAVVFTFHGVVAPMIALQVHTNSCCVSAGRVSRGAGVARLHGIVVASMLAHSRSVALWNNFGVLHVFVSVRAWRHVCGRCGLLGVLAHVVLLCVVMFGFVVVCVRVVPPVLAFQVLLRCCCFGAVFGLASTRARLCDVFFAMSVSGGGRRFPLPWRRVVDACPSRSPQVCFFLCIINIVLGVVLLSFMVVVRRPEVCRGESVSLASMVSSWR